jgi:carboxymethylenebutenolidase
VPDARTVADLEGAADHLRARDDASGRVGCVGFCAGGRACLLFACESDRLDAAVDCWGGFVTAADMEHETTEARPTRVIDLVPRLECPLLAVGGADDTNPSPEHMAELRSRLDAGGKDFEMEIFENASHAFFDDSRPSYVPEAAERLWPRMLDFLGRHLR